VKHDKPKKPWARPEVKFVKLSQEQQDRLFGVPKASPEVAANKR
jgi:hypothetical protein